MVSAAAGAVPRQTPKALATLESTSAQLSYEMTKRIASTIAPLLVLLFCAGCPSTPDEAQTGPEHTEPVDEAGSGNSAVIPPPLPGGPPLPPPGAAFPEPSGAICNFMPADQPVGGVACPEGCVMVLGAPIDEENGCALTGPNSEVALGCLRLPADLRPGGMCYRNPQGHAVAAAVTYPALAEIGWIPCEDDYPFGTVSPCPPNPKGESATELIEP